MTSDRLQATRSNLARGRQLLELSALLRTNLDRCPQRIRFAPDGDDDVALLSWATPPDTLVPLAAGRQELPQLLAAHGPWLPAWPAHAPVGLPATAPGQPRLVFVDLLNDLGETAGGFDSHYPGIVLTLAEIALDGDRAELVVTGDDARRYLTLVPLVSGSDLIGTTYNVVEWIAEGHGAPRTDRPGVTAVMDWGS